MTVRARAAHYGGAKDEGGGGGSMRSEVGGAGVRAGMRLMDEILSRD